MARHADSGDHRRTEETNQLSRLSFFALITCVAMIATACTTAAKESSQSGTTATSSTTTPSVSGTTNTQPTASSGGMPPPRGYTRQQLIFHDQFSGTRLDTSKWSTALGAQGIVWNDFGHLPAPYSGPNAPVTD